MNTDSRDRESVTESKGAGWKWIPQQGVYLWWNGERYTGRAEWDGAEWQVGPLAKPTPKEPPSRRRVAMHFLVVLMFASFYYVGVMGYRDVERECQGDRVCLNEGGMGALTFQLFSLVGCVVFLVLGVRGLVRRRRAHRDLRPLGSAAIDPEPPVAPV